MKVIIIEDEKRTAKELATTIESIDDQIEAVTILSSVEQAISYLQNNSDFDLIFSDIQLSDGLSFEIFNKIRLSVPVIFCTAYDKYALEAFNTNSIDYILKPFDHNSVAKALEKYYTLKSNFSSLNISSDNLLRTLGALSSVVQHPSASIVISHGDKIIPIRTTDIALFVYEDDYVFALTFDLKRSLVSQSLEELESVCGTAFFRANRQYLINRKAVKDASRHFNRKLQVNLTFNYPYQILMSRLKAAQFIKWLAQN
ncbi:MAG TPA: DNA-binding response regulator [Bacteroidales bacterium]|nr:MAG: DNA-binding response regulator [Bacteroidetes bacterium GWE2_42_24]OFY31264.1 MAG: DNA-binding response regulator [Bacteroidetes bacterium GWF2_43_11]HBZ65641.1 DNA-binding response regulator [Bacteroidales bacterium]